MNSGSIKKEILFNLNLMTPSVKHRSSDWAQRPRSNNNNALPYTLCVCVCVLLHACTCE